VGEEDAQLGVAEGASGAPVLHIHKELFQAGELNQGDIPEGLDLPHREAEVVYYRGRVRAVQKLR